MNRARSLALVFAISCLAASSVEAAGNANWLTAIGNPGISRTEADTASKVLASVQFEGDVVVGGFFGLAGGETALHVARWNGSEWSAIGSSGGVTGRVNALGVFAGELYAGGTMPEKVLRYDTVGDTWQVPFGFPDLAGYAINAIVADTGDIYFCGSFDVGVVGYDGVILTQIGINGVNGYDLNVATAATIYRGQLVVGGTEGSRVRTWNGVSWSPINELDLFEPDKTVRALYVLDDVLYAGGSAGDDAAPEFNWIAAWDGVTWTDVGGTRLRRGLIGPETEGLGITGLSSYQGDLVACGTFTMLDDVPANHIARWTGSEWRPLGSGVAVADLKRFPNTMLEFGGSLYVGGSGFETAGAKPAFRIAEWQDDDAALSVEWGAVVSAGAGLQGVDLASIGWDPAEPDGEATYLPLEYPDRAFDAAEYMSIRGDSLICRLDAAATGVDSRIVMHVERRFRLRGTGGVVSGAMSFPLSGFLDFTSGVSATGGTYTITLPNGSSVLDGVDGVGPLSANIHLPINGLDTAVEHLAVFDFDVRAVAADAGRLEFVVVMPEVFTEAGFEPFATSVDLNEGEGSEYTIALRSAPTSPVTISMSADPTSPVTVTPSVIFTPTDWTTPQPVSLFAADDFVDRTYPTVTISHTVSGAPEYVSLSLSDVTVAVTDNDDAAVVIAGDPIEIVEGLTGSYQVSLSSQPLGAVTVTTSSSNPQVLELVGGPLVFLPESWFTPQNVTAGALDDFEAGDGSATLSHVVTSSDGLYDGFLLPDVAVTVLDNDVVSPLVSLEALNTGAGIRLMWELPSPLDPAATVTLRYAPDSPPLSPVEGAAVENGTGGVFALSETWFLHSPPAADTLYYSAFVAADDVTSPRVSTVVYPVTLTVLQNDSETSIQVTDVPGIDQVRASVRRGGAAAFEVDPVPFGFGGGMWSALLPTAFANDIRGLEFFVVLSGIDLDNDVLVGNEEFPERISNTVSPLAAPAQVGERYRMLSAPAIGVDGAAVVAALDEAYGEESAATWKLRRWNGSVYDRFSAAAPPAFDPGEAYWLISRTSGTWDFDSGTTNWPESDGFFDVPLGPGWNMVGNPAGYTVSLDPDVVRVRDGGTESPVSEVGADVMSGEFFGVLEDVPETFEMLDTLEPFTGMWVRNATPDRRDLTLRLPAGAVGPIPGRSLAYVGSTDAWVGTLEARIVGDEGTTIERAAVERVVERGGGVETRTVAKPPVAPSADVDLALSASADDRRVALWVDDADHPAPVDVIVTAHRSVELGAWSRSAGAGAGDHHIVLRDSATGRTWDMAEVSSIALPSGTHRFVLDVRRGGAEPTPAAFRVHVTPNPTRGATWIDLDTPGAGTAALALFDLQGRRVWSGAVDVRESGRHAVRWDGPREADVAAGVYWLTVEFRGGESGSRTERRREKIVVLR